MTDAPQSSGDEDLDPLGASAPQPVGSGRPPKPPREKRRRWRGRPLLKVAVVVAVVVGLALVPALRSSVAKTPQNRIGISYGGGPIEAAHFQKVVEPGSGLFVNGMFDRLYLYPSDTQTYIVSKATTEGDLAQTDSIVAPSKDRVPIEYQVAMYFKLNTDRLREFHEELGLQYGAYQTAGWRQLIRDTFRQQVESAIQEETRKYDVADLYANADDLSTIQSDIAQRVSDRLTAAVGADFFCSPNFETGSACEPPTFAIKRIDIPEGVATAFQKNRTSQIDVQTSQNQIAQRQAEAAAIEALNEGLAEAGMPYVLLKAIESGQVKFWVLPSDGNVTVQAPEDAAPSTTTDAPSGG